LLEQRKEGVKFDGDKLRYDLIPVKPLAKVAEVYTIGAKKYADRNWEKGIDWGRIYGALQRHSNQWWAGEKNDKEDRQHHLASVVWCALTLMEYEETKQDFDPRKDINKRGYYELFPEENKKESKESERVSKALSKMP
jgi:dATP/dGTP diphosphohydrolase